MALAGSACVSPFKWCVSTAAPAGNPPALFLSAIYRQPDQFFGERRRYRDAEKVVFLKIDHQIHREIRMIFTSRIGFAAAG
jgi:hypothetical protein